MSVHPQFDLVHAFLLKLDGLDVAGQIQAFIDEAIDNGGNYLSPGTKGQCSHLFEISLHNIFATGASDDEAIRNWKKVARAKMTPVEGDGFITVYPPFRNPCSLNPCSLNDEGGL